MVVATVATLGLLVNGNIRYQVGVGRVSGYSVAETFSHRPIVFRLLSAGQAWLPDRVGGLVGPASSWSNVWAFETGFRLVAAVLAAGAAVLLWRGLRTRWGSAAWPYAVAAYAALVFTAPATGEPDWMAALLAVAAVGAALLGRPLAGGVCGGVLLAAAALVKISSLPIALAALLLLWAIDRQRGWIAAASAAGAGVVALVVIWWLAPDEIVWLLQIRALQPDPFAAENRREAGHYLLNLAARWPTVVLLPAFFIGARWREAWPAATALLLTAFAFVYQGQYFVYHSLGFVLLSALLAVRTMLRARAALRWPLLAWTGWTLVLFCLPARLRIEHPMRIYLLAAAAMLGFAAWQWLALRRRTSVSFAGSTWWAAVLVSLSLLATQTPWSAESLNLGTAARTAAASEAALRRELADAERIHALIGSDTPVAYLTFGSATYVLGNPTHCRYPSALFLQRGGAARRVSPRVRGENLACLSDPGAQWLIWDRDWLHRKGAPADLLVVIDTRWECAGAAVIGGYTLCPRRTSG